MDIKSKTYNTIISTKELFENIDDSNWLILDCRGAIYSSQESFQEYAEKRIPSAYYCIVNFEDDEPIVSITANYNGTNCSSIYDVLEEQEFDKDSQIVIYSHTDDDFTNLLWLSFRDIGCANVAVLQGGFNAWIADGYSLENCC